MWVSIRTSLILRAPRCVPTIIGTITYSFLTLGIVRRHISALEATRCPRLALGVSNFFCSPQGHQLLRSILGAPT